MFDWGLLFLQIMLLGAIALRELFLRRTRNLYVMLISAMLLVFVQGQAWWVFTEFESTGDQTIVQLHHTITLDDAGLANLYIGISMIALCATFIVLSVRRPCGVIPEPPLRTSIAASRNSYVLVIGWTLAAAFIVIHMLGGFPAAITALARPSTPGLTVFLIALQLGKLPLLRKIALRAKVNKVDLALFGLVLFLILINSRFLAAFILLQLALLVHYCRKRISLGQIGGLALAMVLIFFVYGLYRDYTNSYRGISLQQVGSYAASRNMRGLAGIVDWFYALNVEGFTGVAGILTYEANAGGLAHDFGFSEFSLFTQLVPNALRNDPGLPVAPIAHALESAYPYHDSIVPPGMEDAYAHFGLPGIVAFGVLLGALLYAFHRQMQNPRADRLLIALISVQCLTLVRDTFHNALFFGLGDACMLFLYRVMLGFGRGNKVGRGNKG